MGLHEITKEEVVKEIELKTKLRQAEESSWESNFNCTRLTGTDFRAFDFSSLDFARSEIRNVVFIECSFGWVYFWEAKLSNVKFLRCNFFSTTFSYAEFDNCVFEDCSLYSNDFDGAKFYETDFNYCALNNCSFCRTTNPPCIPFSCPSHGEFIGWKGLERGGEYYLIKLRIPADAKRSSANSRKCRCDKAEVLAIYRLNCSQLPIEYEEIDEVLNNNYEPTLYKAGEMVYPDIFDENRWNECSHGIHFFIDKHSALQYIGIKLGGN